MERLLLALRCFFLILFARRLPPEALALLPAPAPGGGEPERALPPPAEKTAGAAAEQEAARDLARAAERQASERRGAILLLGLFQREGRLVDFLLEEVDGFSDPQIGAAVRDIHRGCKKVLGEHLAIEPVMGQPDNATVRIDTGFDPSRIRLVGNVAGAPPFLGTLRHPGWQSAVVTLPELPASHDATVIAPAEVEL